MNPRTRRAALYAVGVIAFLASANALGHSYAGLYDWAIHHDLAGWQALSWPAEIDVFLAIGELALYIAYLDAWPARQRVWPWATALAGLTVSIAGNIGHIQPRPGHPVLLADRLTAATSPIAAFAGLAIGLLVLKMTRQHATPSVQDLSSLSTSPSGQGAPAIGQSRLVAAQAASASDRGHSEPVTVGSAATVQASRVVPAPNSASAGPPSPSQASDSRPRRAPAASMKPSGGLLHDATAIYQSAAASGERISQRTLARQLRGHGHQFSNQHLHAIAATIGLAQDRPGAGDSPIPTAQRQQLTLVAGK